MSFGKIFIPGSGATPLALPSISSVSIATGATPLVFLAGLQTRSISIATGKVPLSSLVNLKTVGTSIAIGKVPFAGKLTLPLQGMAMATAKNFTNLTANLTGRSPAMATGRAASMAPLVLLARSVGMATARQTINTAAQAFVNLIAVGIAMGTNRVGRSAVLNPFRREYYRPSYSMTSLEGGFNQSREFTT